MCAAVDRKESTSVGRTGLQIHGRPLYRAVLALPKGANRCTAFRYVKNPIRGKWNRKIKTYHIAISLEVAADDEEEAAREAMTKVIDPTMVIEAITELHGHDEEQD